MSSTYQAVQALGGGKLQLVELPLTAPPAGHVRIRVEACGVCHTDAFTIEGGIPGLTYPRVPGHEVIGRIDVLGADRERMRRAFLRAFGQPPQAMRRSVHAAPLRNSSPATAQ